MKRLQHLSSRGLIGFIIATTLPLAACQTTQTGTAPAGTTAQAVTSDTEGSLSGVVYIGTATDGRLVPPKEPISVEVLNIENKLLTSVQTDDFGRFFLRNLKVSPENKVTGEEVTVRIQRADFSRALKLFPGRVVNLSAIRMVTDSPKQQTKSITGILLGPDQSPLGNVTVRDKEFTFRSTTTDASGRFLLDVVGEEIEVVTSQTVPPFGVSISEFQKKQIVTIDTNNVRTVKGIVQDSTNSNLFLSKVRVKVAGTSVSALTNAKGEYVLNGAPVGPFTLEAEAIDGYTGVTNQVSPANITNGKPDSVTQNLFLRPVGSIQVNFRVEDAPFFGQPESNPNIPPVGCIVGFNCRQYDLNGDTITENVYHNGLGVLETDGNGGTLDTLVNVEGTEISERLQYPPAPKVDLKGTDAAGEVKTFTEAVIGPNIVQSVLLNNVPGGKQNITISMTGMQTQKSISVFVPPKDTISTDLIILFRARPVFGVGDVKGTLKIIDEKGNDVSSKINFNNIKIAYVDVPDDLAITNKNDLGGLERSPDLLRRTREALASADRSMRLTDKTFYLKNVTTGSRVMIIAGLLNDNDQVLADCFVPNAATLLNVRPGVVNFAPDMSLTLRPIAGCGG